MITVDFTSLGSFRMHILCGYCTVPMTDPEVLSFLLTQLTDQPNITQLMTADKTTNCSPSFNFVITDHWLTDWLTQCNSFAYHWPGQADHWPDWLTGCADQARCPIFLNCHYNLPIHNTLTSKKMYFILQK